MVDIKCLISLITLMKQKKKNGHSTKSNVTDLRVSKPQTFDLATLSLGNFSENSGTNCKFIP